MSVATMQQVTGVVSPEMGMVVESALHRLVQQVIIDSMQLNPVPLDHEVTDALRASVGEDAVRIFHEFMDDLGF